MKVISKKINLGTLIMLSNEMRRLQGKEDIVEIAASGISMYPTIIEGDKIRVDTRMNKDLSVGDIIVYESYFFLICHRIIKSFLKDGERFYITKGDSIKSAFEEVMESEVMGKATTITRRGRSFDPYKLRYNKLEKMLLDLSLSVSMALKEIKFYAANILYKIQSTRVYHDIAKNFIDFNNIKYHLVIPRDKMDSSDIFRYINMPVADMVLNRANGFLSPLKDLTDFKIMAKAGDDIVGVLTVIKRQSQDEISWLGTSVSVRFFYRGLKIEEALIDMAIEILKRGGFDEIFFIASSDNRMTNKLLNKASFVKIRDSEGNLFYQRAFDSRAVSG